MPYLLLFSLFASVLATNIYEKKGFPFDKTFLISRSPSLYFLAIMGAVEKNYSPRKRVVIPGKVTMRAFPPAILWCLLFPRVFLNRFG